MKVLHVIGPMRTGGAQTQLLGLVKAAHGIHWEATVVATSPGPMSRSFRETGVPFIELKRRASPGLARMWKLRSIVTRGNFDVIHGNLWQSNVYCRVAAIGRRSRPVVVVSERNVEHGRSWAKRWLDARLAKVTDVYVGNTHGVVDFIRDVHPVGTSTIVMIPNAVDREIFKPMEGQRQRGVVIGSVGRLDPEKGYSVLIAATRLLRNRGVPTELRIAGEGPMERELAELVGDLPVDFVGPLDPGRPVAEFLRELDVFCLPSTRREGRPNVVLEALATGLPVVATAIPGMDEIISRDVLVASGDVDRLASAIETALAAPDDWKRLSAPSPVYGFDQLARKYADLFAQTVALGETK